MTSTLRQQNQPIDSWSYFDYKEAFGLTTGLPNAQMAPTWVGPYHTRRLQAYKFLEALCMNAARSWMDAMKVSEEEMDDRREYGDPNVIVEQIKASLLGEDWSLTVEDYDDKEKNKNQYELLQTWRDEEQVDMKILKNERQSIKFGDSVFVLSWDEDNERPRLTVWDPGFYFPVENEEDPTDDFPEKVHIAYEFVRTVDGKEKTYIRRQTWELVPLDDPRCDPTKDRKLIKWNKTRKGDAKPATRTCLYTDAEWEMPEVKNTVEDFTATGALYEEEDLDLNLDFLPVIHMPNTIADAHFGVSSLAYVLQVLEDLVSTDTDLQASSSTTGSPPLWVDGSVSERDDDGNIKGYGPGGVIETGGGQAGMIDTSRSLDALIKYADNLLERLSVNARIPESLLGRIKPSEVPSGIALTLSFAPHTSMILEMRLIRAAKYALLFKFVMRYFQQAGFLEDDIVPSRIAFGPFLPSDKKAAMDLVVQGLTAKSISLETAVQMLIMAGFPIEDAKDEVERIIQADYEGASAFIGAGGTVDEARTDLLGLDPLPEPTVPPIPGDGPPVDKQGNAMIPDPLNPGSFIPDPTAGLVPDPKNQPPAGG